MNHVIGTNISLFCNIKGLNFVVIRITGSNSGNVRYKLNLLFL